MQETRGRKQEAVTGAWGRIRRRDNQVRDSQSTKKEAGPGDSKHEHNVRVRGERTVWYRIRRQELDEGSSETGDGARGQEKGA